MAETKKPAANGVAETGAHFRDETGDRWAVALERLDAHERGGVGTMSVEEFGAALRAEIVRQRKEVD